MPRTTPPQSRATLPLLGTDPSLLKTAPPLPRVRPLLPRVRPPLPRIRPLLPRIRPPLPRIRPLLPRIRPLLLGAALGLVLSGCGGNGSTTGTGEFDGAAFPPGVRAPDFVLTDQDGRTVSLSGQRGRVVMLAFLWTGCRTCTLVAEQVRGALDELGTRAGVRTLLIDTSPRTTTRARVVRFLQNTSLAGRASYLSGPEAHLRRVWRAYSVAAAGRGGSAAEAGIVVLLIDRRGLERVGFGTEQITPQGLSHDVGLLERD